MRCFLGDVEFILALFGGCYQAEAAGSDVRADVGVNAKKR